MSLPTNLNDITSEVPASALSPQHTPVPTPQQFHEVLMSCIPYELRKYFDTGYNFYKSSDNNDMVFIKNILLLFSLFQKTATSDAAVEVEKQDLINDNIDTIVKNFENSLKSHENILNILKINKKVFDARKLFMIIIGYAISNIQKSN